jgi:hypothetical protein
MQCKDIPTRPILEFLKKSIGQWCFSFSREESERSVFWAMPEGTPWKLGHAKMKKLVKKGFVDGCTCGCRGDYEITKKGLDYINSIGFDTTPLLMRNSSDESSILPST